MNLTKEQKKYALIGIALVGIYYAPSLIMSARRMAYMNAARARAAQQAAQIQAQPKTDATQSTIPQTSAADIAASRLTGVWSGRKLLNDNSFCKIDLEIRPADPGSYSGSMTLSCGSMKPQLPGSMAVNRGIGGAMSELSPTAVILTGKVTGGALHFEPEQDRSVKAQSVAATTPSPAGDNDRHVTAVEARPFGNGKISVTWEEDHKPAGQILLARTQA